MKDNDPHPGISIHKIPVGGGFAGLIFTIGSIAIFLAGLPAFWYVHVLAVALGIGIAIVLRLMHS